MMMMRSLQKLFKGRHFEREIIVLCVVGYLRYKLSYRDQFDLDHLGVRGQAAAAIWTAVLST